MWQEFKEFAMKGNVMDLAVGVIIGGAFGKIVSSLVGDIITPLVGLLMGGKDFSGLQVQIGDTAIMYGAFVQNVIDFLIIAWVIFMMVKAMNRLRKRQEVVEEAAGPGNEEILLTEIRDLLKEKR
ncbi:MAG: large conductance mechanosensitive channel protein MscL [Syntrophomonadaceae bacterium]|jgi:large conductance mechanosensitive channel|nr:large conductance mechanosensitive channel protein MscL [Syntrophomonadaceae bacterium]